MPRADSGLDCWSRWSSPGSGLGLLVSQLNNYTLAPISEERVSEAAGVNSAAGKFGLSFGLAFAGAIMLAALSFLFTNMAEASTVLTPAEQQQVADVLEDDAQVVSDTQLQELLVGQPQATQDEISDINKDARPRSLQIALLVPFFAGMVGLVLSFRMVRLPVIEPAAALERGGVRLRHWCNQGWQLGHVRVAAGPFSATCCCEADTCPGEELRCLRRPLRNLTRHWRSDPSGIAPSRRRLDARILVISRMATRMGMSTLSYGAITYLARSGASQFQISLVNSAQFLAALLFAVQAGVLADLLSKRTAMLIAFVMQAALCFLIPSFLGTGVGTLMLLMFLTSALSQLVTPSVKAMVALVSTPRSSRRRAHWSTLPVDLRRRSAPHSWPRY